MIKIAIIDDIPTVATVCEKLLIQKNAITNEDIFDKFTNSRAFLQAFHHWGINHYDLVICDHHLEENEDISGYDLLMHIQILGYKNFAVLYSADNEALNDISLIVDKHKIDLLSKDRPGNTESIDHITDIIREIKGF